MTVFDPVINARSARGLSLTAYILETLSYAITLVYSFRNNFPFSTYGENLFLTVQNILITLLIIAYAPDSGGKGAILATAVAASASAYYGLTSVSQDVLAYLQVATLPLSLFSKLPQIRQNYLSKSTGQVSAIAIVAQIAGCVARLFTTSTEVGDPIVTAGFGLALVLNIILGVQLWIYWGSSIKETPGKAAVTGDEKQRGSPSPAPGQRVGTPPPASGSQRKWTRKVD